MSAHDVKQGAQFKQINDKSSILFKPYFTNCSIRILSIIIVTTNYCSIFNLEPDDCTKPDNFFAL